jgi:EXLDI family protein
MHMPNKTIYVSEQDASLFEEAKNIAGEALSSVISRALREYVSRRQQKDKGMKEVSLKIGSEGTEREQRFVGAQVGEWTGFSDDKEWWLSAKIYRTQKNNWAIYFVHECKASLLMNKTLWKVSGDYLINAKSAELLVTTKPEGIKQKLPKELYKKLQELAERDEKPVEYLDI